MPYVQRHFRHFMTTAMARFRAGKPLVYFDQVFTCRCCFVFQLGDEPCPACIADGAGQFVVLHHVGCFQCLDTYCRLVFVNNSAGEFVLKIGTGMSDPLVNGGQLKPRLPAIGTAFLLARQRFLLTAQVPAGIDEMARVRRFPTVRVY